MRATVSLVKDEPVTWSYFREEGFTDADWMSRGSALMELFSFACMCTWCQRERPLEINQQYPTQKALDHPSCLGCCECIVPPVAA